VTELAGGDSMTGPPRPAPAEIDHSGYTGPGFDLLGPGFEPHLPAAHPDAAPATPHGTTSPSVSRQSLSMPSRSATAPPTRPPGPPAPQPAPHPPRPAAPARPQPTVPPGQHTPRTLQDGAQPAIPPSRRGGLVAVVLAVLLVGTGLGVGGILLLGGGDKKPTPPPTTPTSAASPSRSAAVVPARVLRAATPRNVRAVGKGRLASLHWTLARGNNYPILVQQADEQGSQAPQALPKHTLSTTISGLDASRGYCFTVGAIVALGQSNGQPATIAWSKPACIRGATVQ
jgi:serine/threonine-protein kinase PknK